MSTLIANLAIQGAIAAIGVSIAALIAAAANWVNVRSRLMEQGMQIADLQRLTAHLATVQQMQTSLNTPSAPTIVTMPAATLPAAAQANVPGPAPEPHA